MNTELALKQFSRMMLSGTISTIIAILSARRFESWWAGLIGVPIALLLCDVRQSWLAISFSFQAMRHAGKEGIKSALNHYCPWLAKVRTWLTPNIDRGDCDYALTVLSWVLPILLSALLLSCIIQFLSGFYLDGPGMFLTGICFLLLIPIAVVSVYINSAFAKSKRFNFPITRQLRRFQFFREWDESTKKGSTKTAETKVTKVPFRDEKGKVFSWTRCLRCMKDRLEIFAFLYVAVAINILWLLMAVDWFLAIFMKVTVSRSVALAMGVVIGFSADYLYCPLDASQLTKGLWLVACSLLGGMFGWLLWIAKEKLAELPLPQPKEVLSAR